MKEKPIDLKNIQAVSGYYGTLKKVFSLMQRKLNGQAHQIDQKFTHLKNGETYYIDNHFGAQGVNQFEQNEFLYISSAPEQINAELTSKLNIVDSDQEDSIEIKAGKNELEKIIRSIKKLHPQKDITFLILGEYEKKENFGVYQEGLPKDEANEEDEESEARENLGHIKKFTISKNQSLVSIDLVGNGINLFYLDAYENHMTLSNRDLATLYEIYHQTIDLQSPLLIHDKHSLNLAPKIAFSFELLRQFDKCFDSQDIYKIRDNLLKLYEEVKKARSPDALSNPKDLQQSIYLAFALKLIRMDHQCRKMIGELLEKYRTDAGFESRATAIQEILNNLVNRKSPLEQKVYLSKLLLDNNELHDHHKLTFLPSAVRGHPTHYTLLNDLRLILGERVTIEQEVLELCNTYLKKEEDSLYEEDDREAGTLIVEDEEEEEELNRTQGPG